MRQKVIENVICIDWSFAGMTWWSQKIKFVKAYVVIAAKPGLVVCVEETMLQDKLRLASLSRLPRRFCRTLFSYQPKFISVQKCFCWR